MLNEHFAAGYQKVGTFQLINGRKTGGNVATYFCTADCGVLHAIAGPVDADTLLRETKWVLDIHEKAKKAGKEGEAEYVKVVRQAHAERLKQDAEKKQAEKSDGDSARKPRRAGSERSPLAVAVHRLLAKHAGDDIDQVYPEVWEGILREKIFKDRVP